MIVHRENASGEHPEDPSDHASADAHAFHDLRTLPGTPSRRGGAHSVPAPPHAIKGRAAVVAVAAGAAVAAGQTLAHGAAGDGHSTSSDAIALAAGTHMVLSDADDHAPEAATQAADPFERASDGAQSPAVGSLDAGPEVLDVNPQLQQAADVAQQLATGAQFAAQRANAEALSRRPQFVKPASGELSSLYGGRWGVLHGGIDIANAMHTPIYAATDGEVISAGPASGFGQWVRIEADDGTVTVYGHIDVIEVEKGDHVTAGDEIAKMGSRGFSTGSHLHFEVWKNGTDRTDPLPWLTEHGISVADGATGRY